MSNTYQNSEKKGGPYSETDRPKCRHDVYKLHFEQHLSATAIAEVLGVNRNTVNADIEYLYEELAATFDRVDIAELTQRQLSRLDSQRARLLTYLEQVDDYKESLAIERRIFEIDIQIARIAGNVYRGNLACNLSWHQRVDC